MGLVAFLRKYLGSKFWFGGFKLPDGKRVQRSTKETDRSKALKVVLAWEQASRDRSSEAQLFRVFNDISEQLHGRRIVQATFAEYSEKWLARKKGETEAVTLAVYRSAVADFIAFLGPKAATPLHHISPGQIAEWRSAAAARATARTANNKLKILRTLFGTAWRDGLIADNPAAKLTSLKTADSTRRPFTMAEIKAVLAVADTEWSGMVLAGLYLGQRMRDLAGLTWANVDLQKGEVRLQTSKTGRRQFIPIAKPLRRYLEALPASDDPRAPIFPTLHKRTLEQSGSAQLSQAFYGVLVDAGLVKARPNKSVSQGKSRQGGRVKNEISFHSLRHTATSWLKEKGVSESVARDLIGHESKQVSQLYTHTSEESRIEAIDRLPDVYA